jgi:nicotinamide riboside transporter PnuC
MILFFLANSVCFPIILISAIIGFINFMRVLYYCDLNLELLSHLIRFTASYEFYLLTLFIPHASVKFET